MHGLALLERRTEGTVQTVLQVELAPPGNHMGKKVPVERRVLLKQRLEIKGPLRGDQLIQAHLMRSDCRPLLLHVAVVGVRSLVADTLENHLDTVVKISDVLRHDIVTI